MIFLKKQVKKVVFLMMFIAINCNAFANKKHDYSRLITAIGTVESKMNDKAVNGKYAGFLQISPNTIKDVNRINKIKGNPKRYTLKDRFNRQKSIEIFHVIQGFYNKHGDLHYAILIWNEGCSAMNKPKRKTKYYQKVMNVYNKLG